MAQNNSKKRLKIFVIPIEFIGHTTACIGLGQAMVERGHEVTFVIDDSRHAIFKQYNFNIEIVDNYYQSIYGISEIESIRFNEMSKLYNSKITWLWDYMRMTITSHYMNYKIYNRMVNKNKQFKALIEKYDPDIFILDDFISYN